MGCTGSSTSPSARMTAGYATAPPPVTSPFCARSPSTSSPETAVVEPAYAAGARRPPGTTITCSGSSLAKLMREPCMRCQLGPAPKPHPLGLGPLASFAVQLGLVTLGSTLTVQLDVTRKVVTS